MSYVTRRSTSESRRESETTMGGSISLQHRLGARGKRPLHTASTRHSSAWSSDQRVHALSARLSSKPAEQARRKNPLHPVVDSGAVT